MLTKLSQKNFNIFRNRLINYSRKFNIPFEDLEEIVNDSILKALNHFDNDRGSFESLCLVIIKNKIINFTRDNSKLYMLVLIDENEDIVDADADSFEEKEINEFAQKYLTKLRNKLSEEELKLFNEIYEMCESSKKVSVSKASVNIGLEPTKGWDLFRKIQRKAKQDASSLLLKEGISIISEKDLGDSLASRVFEEPEVYYQLDDTDSVDSVYVFLNSLSKDNSNKLDSIYNF